ncbi:MAG: hypothetical protein WC453_03955 [Patescibacteria group bacterium]
MFNTILGVVLLLFPFLLIFRFSDRWRGFLYILTADIAWHLTVALITQAFHIFSYPLILVIHSLLAVAVLWALVGKNSRPDWQIKINWLAIAAFAIIIFELASVHYFYSGAVSSLRSQDNVARESYIYPYFSDEWVGVAFVKRAIASHSLPIVNPLIDGFGYQNFPNIFVAFFAFLAEIFLLLNLAPLTGYAILGIVFGALICWLVYVLLRNNQVGPLAATVGALCLPYITNGQNLAGIWYLLPLTGGLPLLLISLTAGTLKDKALAGASGLLAVIIYPPLVVFCLPAYLALLCFDAQERTAGKLRNIIYGAVALAAAAALVVFIQRANFGQLSGLFATYLIYPSLTRGIPSFAIWNIIPWIILPFAAIGLIRWWRERAWTLLIPIYIGLLLWIIYTRSLSVFIIGYDRTVVITSFLIVGAGAAGLDYLAKLAAERWPFLNQTTTRRQIALFVLAIFLLLSWNYTQRDNWRRLILRTTVDGREITVKPLAPATNFFTAEDRQLFGSLSHGRFLSNDWKGLVIGAATGNWPLNSKDSIVTNKLLDFGYFGSLDCADKYQQAVKYELGYVYSPAFDCPNFQLLGSSNEDLYLYHFQP